MSTDHESIDHNRLLQIRIGYTKPTPDEIKKIADEAVKYRQLKRVLKEVVLDAESTT